VVGIDPVLDQGRKGRAQADQCQERDGGTLPTFRDAYQKRRCILPVDNFFEWKAFKGAKAKQPYAIAMKSGEPFGWLPSGRTGSGPDRGMGAHLLRPHLSGQRADGRRP